MKIKLKQSDIVILILILIAITSYILLKLFTIKSEPILMDYAASKSTNYITSVMNATINKVLYETKENIIEIEKDKEGNIINLNFNNNAINKVLYLTTSDILVNIKQLENGNFNFIKSSYITSKDNIYFLPFGVIYDMPILVNLSPSIPFKIEFLGSVNNEVKVNVKEYGINSSLIEVAVKYNLKMQIILPFKSKTISFDKNIILDNKIIQGKIPNYYGGIISSSLK